MGSSHISQSMRDALGRFTPAPPPPPPKPVMSTTVLKMDGFAVTYELDEDCLNTLTEKLNLSEPATHATVASFVEGVLSGLVNFDHDEMPPDFSAYRKGQKAIDVFLEAFVPPNSEDKT